MNPRDWIRRQLRLLRRAVKNLEALERQFAKDEKRLLHLSANPFVSSSRKR